LLWARVGGWETKVTGRLFGGRGGGRKGAGGYKLTTRHVNAFVAGG